jgi:acyl-CoA thioesterase FadM
MPAPRTTYTTTVRSYELGNTGKARSVAFLRWFQEAAYTNSAELGFTVEWYQNMGVSWVLREIDLELLEHPGYDETIHITTWISDMQRVTANREYEAHRNDGTLLARSSALWVVLDLNSQRPARIPIQMLGTIEPGQDFALEARDWPRVQNGGHRSHYTVPFWEEDQLIHVNNANYLNWIEESARRAAMDMGMSPLNHRRHRLRFRLPAFKDDQLTFYSACTREETPGRGGEEARGWWWEHRIERDGQLLVEAWSYTLEASREKKEASRRISEETR